MIKIVPMARIKGLVVAVALLTGSWTWAFADMLPQDQIKAALTQWTSDFNAGRADKVCGLFAQDLRANVRGAAERDYASLCGLLQRSLSDRTKRYSYALEIKEILVSGDSAVVRLVWTLTVVPVDAPMETSIEPGMDVFRREADGSWKIMRFMAYQQ
jgi:ketosteroid isomerase-like protein